MFRLHAKSALLLFVLGAFLHGIAHAGEKYALLIGVRQYTKEHLRSLRYSETDITGMAAALQDADYRAENVILMTQTVGVEDRRYMPSHANIRKELRLLLQGRDKADTVLIGFAGHGIQFLGADEHYFLPMDADLRDKTTLIGLNELYRELQRCPAQLRLLIVDACRDDPQVGQAPLRPKGDTLLTSWPHEADGLFYCAARLSSQSQDIPKVDLESVTRPQKKQPPRGVAALFSCDAGEKAYESDQLKHSVFFNFVIEGLRGKADLFGDNNITLGELETYTAKRVKAFVEKEYHEEQSPRRVGDSPAGLVLVTLNGNKPAELGISNRNVNPRLARRLGLPRPTGVRIQGVLPGLAADKAGLRRGDVILKINDTAIADSDRLDSTLARFKSGDNITVEVLRARDRMQVNVVLAARLSRSELAQRLLQEAKRDEAWAQYDLSLMYALGDGVAFDTSAAMKWIRQAAENGLARAQNSLGWIYRYGDFGVERDDREAARWYLKAAEQDESNAQVYLGDMYRLGQGVRQDEEEAYKWYRRAAEDELPTAQNDVGNMYHLGRGVAKDDREAVKWYRKAAEQGFPEAQRNLGLMYRLGLGVERDDKAAFGWYRRAAEQGDLLAEYNLGNLYLNGWGVEKNYEEAVKCYRQAAEKELPVAQGSMGLVYLKGSGVEKDPEAAFRWFRQAADNGFAPAQRYVAQMYHLGLGVEKDLNKALKWYRRAADNGDEEAQKRLKRLEPE